MKACVFCKHCRYEQAVSYSMLTYQEASIECRKSNFFVSDFEDLQGSELYEIAQSCEDYELNDNIKSYLEAKGE